MLNYLTCVPAEASDLLLVDGITMLPVLNVQPHQLRPIPGLPPYPLMFILLEMITRCSPLPSTRRHCHLMLLHLMQGMCSHPPAAVLPSMAAEVPLLGALVSCSKAMLTTNWSFTDLAAVVKLQLLMGCQVLELLGGMFEGLGGARDSQQQHSRVQQQLQELQQQGGAQPQSQEQQSRQQQQQGQQNQQDGTQLESSERQCEGEKQQQQQSSSQQQSGHWEQGQQSGSQRQQVQQSAWHEQGKGSGSQQQRQQEEPRRRWELGEGSGAQPLGEQRGPDQKAEQQAQKRFEQLVLALGTEYLDGCRSQQQQQHSQTSMHEVQLSDVDEWHAYAAAARPAVEVIVDAFVVATNAAEKEKLAELGEELWASAVAAAARAAAAAHLDSAPVLAAVDAADKAGAAEAITVAMLEQVIVAMEAAMASGKGTVKVDIGAEAAVLESDIGSGPCRCGCGYAHC